MWPLTPGYCSPCWHSGVGISDLGPLARSASSLAGRRPSHLQPSGGGRPVSFCHGVSLSLLDGGGGEGSWLHPRHDRMDWKAALESCAPLPDQVPPTSLCCGLTQVCAEAGICFQGSRGSWRRNTSPIPFGHIFPSPGQSMEQGDRDTQMLSSLCASHLPPPKSAKANSIPAA